MSALAAPPDRPSRVRTGLATSALAAPPDLPGLVRSHHAGSRHPARRTLPVPASPVPSARPSRPSHASPRHLARRNLPTPADPEPSVRPPNALLHPAAPGVRPPCHYPRPGTAGRLTPSRRTSAKRATDHIFSPRIVPGLDRPLTCQPRVQPVRMRADALRHPASARCCSGHDDISRHGDSTPAAPSDYAAHADSRHAKATQSTLHRSPAPTVRLFAAPLAMTIPDDDPGLDFSTLYPSTPVPRLSGSSRFLSRLA